LLLVAVEVVQVKEMIQVKLCLVVVAVQVDLENPFLVLLLGQVLQKLLVVVHFLFQHKAIQ
jgi:hypothetical protein